MRSSKMAASLFKINVSAIVFSDDKYFMIRRADDEEVFPGHWGVAGGTVEAGDASLEDALIREFLEEVRAKVIPGEIISNNVAARGDKNMLYVVMTAQFADGEKPEVGEDTAEIGWLDIEEIRELKLTPGTLEVIETHYGAR